MNNDNYFLYQNLNTMTHNKNYKAFYRRLTLILLCMVFGSLAKAQYLPIAIEGKYWILEKYNSDDIPRVASAYALVIGEDTVVNGLSYKKVYRASLAGSHPCPPQSMPCFVPEFPYRSIDKQLVSFIREDIAGKKVYNRPVSRQDFFCDTLEYLALDFSLDSGDTLNRCVFEAIGGLALHGWGLVDSTGNYDFYDKNRNTLYTTGYQSYLGLPPIGPVRIMEGIGFENYGLFHDSRAKLIDFCAGSAESCEILSSVAALNSLQTVTIFPNPSKGVFHVKASEGQLQCIRVYDALGVLKKEACHTNAIDMAMFENGVYFMALTDDDGNSTLRTVSLLKNN